MSGMAAPGPLPIVLQHERNGRAGPGDVDVLIVAGRVGVRSHARDADDVLDLPLQPPEILGEGQMVLEQGIQGGRVPGRDVVWCGRGM